MTTAFLAMASAGGGAGGARASRALRAHAHVAARRGTPHAAPGARPRGVIFDLDGCVRTARLPAPRARAPPPAARLTHALSS